MDKKMIGDTGTIRGIVIAFYIANEGLGILENAAVLDVPYPKKLRDTISQLKNKDDLKQLKEKQNTNKSTTNEAKKR